MKKTIRRMEPFRIKFGDLASDEAFGKNGAFDLPASMLGRDSGLSMRVVVSDASDWPAELGSQKWEHVSASWPDRCPSWGEMCRVKSFFWDEGEPVWQLHPRQSDYVNFHPLCLHLWKPSGFDMPLPPTATVGPRDALREEIQDALRRR